MLHIALFGGSFDPVHLGHIQVAETILDKLIADQVWFVPSANHPQKEGSMFTFQQRIQFLNEIAKTNPNFAVCDNDVLESGKSYTIFLIKGLKAIYPKYKFSFVIGADNVTKLKTWHNYEELLDITEFIVINRETADKKEWANLPYYNKLIFVDMPLVNISSSDVRQKIAKDIDVSDLIPKELHELVMIR
jgi:nicotinate-nucleotide adenylyltransferase